MDVEPGKIVLFKNNQKKEGTKQPDVKGSCNIDGVIYEVAIWYRESAKGNKFMSGLIKPDDYRSKSEIDVKKSGVVDAPKRTTSEDLPF